MKRNNYYDVTDWQVGNPYTDIGEVINSIIADIKNRQKDTNVNEWRKTGSSNLYSVWRLSFKNAGENLTSVT